MTIEKCWYELNIPCENALNPNWAFPDVTEKEFGVWSFKAHEIFNLVWLSDLAKRGLPIAEALVFYRAPGHNTYNAHLDIHRNHPVKISTFGLNFIVGGKDSPMTWYHTPEIKEKPKPGGAGTIYHNWPIHTLTEIDRHIIKENTLTLVRVGIPHTVLMNNDARWCISARTQLSQNMYWKDITQWMRDKGFLEERAEDV